MRWFFCLFLGYLVATGVINWSGFGKQIMRVPVLFVVCRLEKDFILGGGRLVIFDGLVVQENRRSGAGRDFSIDFMEPY